MEFDAVLRHSLYTSPSKQTYRFGTSSRFQSSFSTPCLKTSYDLSSTMMTSRILKTSRFSRASRFDNPQDRSPSAKYQTEGFAEINKKDKKGNKFGSQEKMKFKVQPNPGPGTYKAQHDPYKNLSYTMRSKNEAKVEKTMLGPGRYKQPSDITKTGKKYLTNYKSSKAPLIGRQERECIYPTRKTSTLVSPARYNEYRTFNNGVTSNKVSSKSHRFGLKEKMIFKPDMNPGPGSYNNFSQFETGLRLKTSYC